MNRRDLLRGAVVMGAVQALTVASPAQAADEASPKCIVLYCDLAFDPANEQEMLHKYHQDFKPAAEKFEGFMDLKMVKLRKVIQGGPAPAANINYRFQLTYKSEELRQRWIASPVHKRLWPQIEALVANKDYLVLLTDNA